MGLNKELTNLSELVISIGKIYRTLKNHIGYGGKAHQNATIYASGFMSPDDKKAIEKGLNPNGTFGLYINQNEIRILIQHI